MATQRDAATAHSAFFLVLPRELRDAILTAAFGGRTIHIQQYNLATPPGKGIGSGWVRGGARQWLGGLFTTSKSKAKRGHGRRWYASICDRDHREIILENSPAADNCMFDIEKSQWNGTRPFDVPAELAIGALGWLLTCGQAYNEGIEVLYASNTFHIRSNDLRAFGGFIPQIPKAGLSYITSMELIMEPRFAASQVPDLSPAVSQADILEDTLSRIANLMPRLQKLYLGFCPFTCLLEDCKSPHRKLTYECSRYQVSLMEATVRDLRQSRRSCELELGLPLRVYEQYEDEVRKNPTGRGYKVGTPYWKSVRGGNASWAPRFRIFCHVEDQRSDPDLEDDVSTGLDVGYWISMSSFDHDQPTMGCYNSVAKIV